MGEAAPDPQRDGAISGTGVIGSLGALFSVLSRLRERLEPSRRRIPRLPFAKTCQLEFEGAVLQGTTRDISFAGVTVVFPGKHEMRPETYVLSIEDVKLTVTPIESVVQRKETLVRFRIETIENGEPTWQAWHQLSSR